MSQNVTSTQIIKDPTYVEGPATAFSQRITSLLDPSKIQVDPSKFQEQVAGLGPLQQQAAQMAATQAGLGKLMTGNPDPRAGARALYRIQDQLEAMV